jgi:hypothetical protein
MSSHIGYGTWYLRETVRDHPEQADVVRATLHELLPAAADSLQAPAGADTAVLSADTDELRGCRGRSRQRVTGGVAGDSASCGSTVVTQ